MDSRNRNRTIHYEGDVNLWQGANRIQADTVDIDRMEEAHAGGRRPRGHQSLGGAEGRCEGQCKESRGPPC